MLALNFRMKATLVILVWVVVCPTAVSRAQESDNRSWWNPLGLGMGTTTTSTNKYTDYSGSSLTPAPDTSMPKMSDSGVSSWEWPTLPTPKWQAPTLSWPKPAWPSWMKSSGKSTSSSSSSTNSWSRSTKRWWKNTTKMLNPFPSSGNGVVSSSDSFSGGYSSSSSTGKSNSSSWSLFNWWGEPEEQKLQTPNDFFSLPKP